MSAAAAEAAHHRRGQVPRTRPHGDADGHGAWLAPRCRGRTARRRGAAAARPSGPRHVELAAIDLAHRDDAGEGAGDERFVGAIDVGQREVLFERRDARIPSDFQNHPARDPAEAIFAARRPHLALADDEEVGRIAGGDEAVRVEHQRFVGARLRRLDRGEDAVQLRVRVDLLVLHRRVAAADMDREQFQPALVDALGRLLVFGDDDDGRAADTTTRGSW